MNDPGSSFNPYAAPAPGYVPDVKASPRSGPPGWYTFYCIAAIVLGSLGIANGLMGAVGTAATPFMQPAPVGGNAPAGMEDFIEAQEEMNREMMGVNKRYFYFLLVSNTLLVVLAAALLIGGIMALQMTRRGANILGNTFMILSVFDVARLILTVVQLMETAQLTQKHMGAMMENLPQPQGGAPPPPELGQMMGAMMTGMFGAMICFIVLWTLFKLWLYISGWLYFSKPHVQALLKD